MTDRPDPARLLTRDAAWLLAFPGFEPERERGLEAVLGIGNGYVGTRGSLEEGSRVSLPMTLLNGVFDRIHDDPEPPPDAEHSPTLVVAPNWTALRLAVDDEALSVEQGEALELERVLDLRRGWMVRRWRHRLPSGRVVRLTTLRCASLVDRHALLQRAWIELEGPPGRARLTAALDGRVAEARPNSRPAVPADGRGAPDGVLAMRAPHAPTLIAVAQATRLTGDGARGQERRPDCLAETVAWTADGGRVYVLDRFVSVWTSREDAAPLGRAAAHVRRLEGAGMARLLEAHRRAWSRRWRDMDLALVGDERMQRALRVAAYHLTIAANPEDDRVAVPVRGLVGDVYRGHTFWDNELYLLPFYALTWPTASRALVGYRRRGLGPARVKAERFGYRGALFAWETTDLGQEVCPRSAPTPGGEVQPIVTWRRGHHVSAAVARGVWLHWTATGDDAFMRRAGAEIALETARFWASRARREEDGGWHVRGVIGPDEYHERVDDNAYTNELARFNLAFGAEVADWLRHRDPRGWRRLQARLGLGEDELAAWRRVADGLVLRRDPRTRLIEQFEGYFGLEPVRVEPYAFGTLPLQDAIGRARIQRTQITKQADVVLLFHLFPERFDRETVRANLRYYAPRCEQASSLSPSVYAAAAARAGLGPMALRFLERSAYSDLGSWLPNAADGVHLANMGGLWQAVVFGIAGLRIGRGGPSFRPALPPGWRSLRVALRYRGRRLGVVVEAGTPGVAVRVGSGAPVRLRPGERLLLRRAPRAQAGGRREALAD